MNTTIYRTKNSLTGYEYKCVCDRCGGTGYLPQYRHIENGICFKCRGAKSIARFQRVPVMLFGK